MNGLFFTRTYSCELHKNADYESIFFLFFFQEKEIIAEIQRREEEKREEKRRKEMAKLVCVCLCACPACYNNVSMLYTI